MMTSETISNPLVTVITPLYNHEKYIANCLDSILAQTYQPIEIIVVDDGSTDNSPEIVESYADKGVKLIRNPRNGYGVARALNTAILNARGEYIAWLSSDDLFMPEKIEKNVAHFLETKKSNPNLGVLHSDVYVQIWDPTLQKPNAPPMEEIEAQFAEKGYARWPLGIEHYAKYQMIFQAFLWNPISGCTTFIPRDVYLKAGLFKDTWTLSQDYDMWMRLMFQGYDFMFIAEPLTVSCFHESNSEFYRAQVPAESFLMIRYYSHMLDEKTISEILKWRKFTQADRDFYLELSQIFLQRCLYDHSLIFIEKFQEMGGLLSPKAEEWLEQMRPRFVPLPEIESDSTGFLIVIGEEQKTERLYAVLNHFLQAFAHQKQVSLTLWLQDDPAAMREYIESRLEQAAAFLNLSPSAWPPIDYLTSDSIEEAIATARTFIPISALGELEQRLIYYYHRPGYLVQYLADAPYLKRSVDYFTVWPHLQSQPANIYALLYLDRAPVQWVENGEQSQRFYASTGWIEWHMRDTDAPLNKRFQHVYHLDDWRSLMKHTPKPEVQLCVRNHRAMKGLREQGWTAHFQLPSLPISPGSLQGIQPSDMFEPSLSFRILTVYSESNLTSWQETFQAYLHSYTQADSSELVLYVPASEPFENIEAAVLNQLEILGISEEQAPHIMVMIEEDIGDLSEIIALWAQVNLIALPLKSPFVFQDIFNLVCSLEGCLPLIIPAYLEQSLDAKTQIISDSILESPDLLTNTLCEYFQTLQHIERLDLSSLEAVLTEKERIQPISVLLNQLQNTLPQEAEHI